MKKYILALVAAALIAPAVSAQVRVKGYTRQDGTYVAPHYRSNPNSSTYDNWSTRGNVNPYTGEVGTKDPNAPNSTYSNPYRQITPPPCYYNCPEGE